MVGGRVVMGGSRSAVAFREAWIRRASMTAHAAMASTIGTALKQEKNDSWRSEDVFSHQRGWDAYRGTTQGSCRPLASSTPAVPSYLAVCWACEMVAGGLKPTLLSEK